MVQWLAHSPSTLDVVGLNLGPGLKLESWQLLADAHQFTLQNPDQLVCIGFLRHYNCPSCYDLHNVLKADKNK